MLKHSTIIGEASYLLQFFSLWNQPLGSWTLHLRTLHLGMLYLRHFILGQLNLRAFTPSEISPSGCFTFFDVSPAGCFTYRQLHLRKFHLWTFHLQTSSEIVEGVLSCNYTFRCFQRWNIWRWNFRKVELPGGVMSWSLNFPSSNFRRCNIQRCNVQRCNIPEAWAQPLYLPPTKNVHSGFDTSYRFLYSRVKIEELGQIDSKKR